MSGCLKRSVEDLRRMIAGGARWIPGVAWLLAWRDPLHLARRLLARAVLQRAHHARGCLLDLGCGGKPYRSMFQNVERYIGLDVQRSANVDVVGNGMRLPFRNGTFNTILCNEVLEHVPEPGDLMAEVTRALAPGGCLLLTTPQTWGLHHAPHDFYRYTCFGLKYLAEKHGLQVVEIAPTCGLWATLAQRLVDTIIYQYGARWHWRISREVSVLLAPILLTGFILDKCFGPLGDTLDNVLVARKPGK